LEVVQIDPDQTLSDLRVAVVAWKAVDYKLDFIDPAIIAANFAEWFEALDDWLTNGGFLPQSWKPKP